MVLRWSERAVTRSMAIENRLASCTRTYWLAIVLAMLSTACNSHKAERVIVQGAVTLDSTPVGDGQIRFVPIDGTAGPVSIAVIRDGRYRCDDKGGIPVGRHRIEVLAWDPSLPVGGRGEPSRPQLAPEKYNSESVLVESIEDMGSPLVKDFNLSR